MSNPNVEVLNWEPDDLFLIQLDFGGTTMIDGPLIAGKKQDVLAYAHALKTWEVNGEEEPVRAVIVWQARWDWSGRVAVIEHSAEAAA